MKTIEIKGTLRSETGKKATKAFRKNEQVPAILYGGKDNVMLVVNERDLRPIVYTPNVHIVNINVDGKIYEAIVKEIQFHPVTDRIIHVDFYQISDDKKVTVSLPVQLNGQAEGAKQGGKVYLITRKLRACGFPQKLPEILEVSIAELGLGKSIKVSDLDYKDVQLVDLKSTVVVSCQLTRASRGMSEEEKTAEPTAETAAAAAPAAAAAAPAAEKK